MCDIAYIRTLYTICMLQTKVENAWENWVGQKSMLPFNFRSVSRFMRILKYLMFPVYGLVCRWDWRLSRKQIIKNGNYYQFSDSIDLFFHSVSLRKKKKRNMSTTINFANNVISTISRMMKISTSFHHSISRPNRKKNSENFENLHILEFRLKTYSNTHT